VDVEREERCVSEDRHGLSVVTPLAAAGPTRGWRRHTDPGALRDAWRTAALRAGWSRPRDWWTPEVNAVAEALARGGDAINPCAELGRARAAAGVGIRESLDDLCALYSELPAGNPPLGMVRALTEAWVEEAVAVVRTATCEDPLSGLASGAYLRTRLAELFREADRAGGGAGDRHVLLVVGIAGTPATGAVAGWEGLLLRLELGDCLRSVFSGGETLAWVGPAAVVGLVRREVGLPRMVEALRRRITEFPGLTGTRVWLDGLPATLPAAYDALDRLGR
jgi:hypothetical protein